MPVDAAQAAATETLVTAPVVDATVAAATALFPSTVVDTKAAPIAALAAETPEAKAAADAAAKLTLDRAAETPEAKATREAAEKAEALKNETPEAKATREAAEKKAADDAKAKDAAKVVPEKYEFKAPDGVTQDAAVVEAFSVKAKELKLSQEEAQSLYDIGVQMQQKNHATNMAAIAATQASWLEAAQADKEFGGENLNANMAIAKRALDLAPEMKTMLRETKLGNHPEMIRWMYRVGKLMSSDTVVTGGINLPAKDAAKALYPNQN